MGDVADQMQDEAQEWLDHGEYCKKHREWYLLPHPCLGCEDGEPSVHTYSSFEDLRCSDNGIND